MAPRRSKNNTVNSKNSNEEISLPESERLPLQQIITDFLASNENEILLPGLNNEQRKFLHRYGQRFHLKTRSHGKDTDRVLHISRKTRAAQLGDTRPLKITPATRQTLMTMISGLHVELSRRLPLPPHQQQRQGRLRSESVVVGLGPRMVPSRPNRIPRELYRDKQDLPINAFQEQILEMLKQHSIFIINGETGSGKTTQVPQYILNDAARRNRPCRILVSQPRRVAAVTVAHRVAEERGEQVGESVGYQIRMESRVRKTTNLIYTTSGCLLRTIMGDMQDLFRKATHLIIDEIHERDKYTDFTLITIKEQLKRNKDLKVILMSATMDINLLSNYFDHCPVLNVPGQGFDVKIFHLEDILFHTGYRTALMEKYLRSMNTDQMDYFLATKSNGVNGDHQDATPVRIPDGHLQECLNLSVEQCMDASRTGDDLSEAFDQMQYYIESEGVPVDAGHSETGITPLMVACKRNCPKYVEIFIHHNANVRIPDVQSNTALNYALIHPDGVCTQIITQSRFLMQQQHMATQEELNKQRLIAAYQQQFNDEQDVDHDLILSLIEGLYRSDHQGAIMVFLPGYNDIVAQRDLINSTLPGGTYRLCILHGQMDSQDQLEALQRHSVRKIILSTNIGQTSITIPDLAFIIDSGKVKMKTYESITESSQLQSVWISQADASQRSGRAGRTQNGICYRLYSLTKYAHMPKFSLPEFMRIPLTEICLYAKTLEPACDVQSYLARALNPPSTISVLNAIKKLQILDVFDSDEGVTELGKYLVEIPLDVQLGKCLIYSIYLKCFDPVLTIVAFHSIKDPFILPSDRNVQGQASFQRKSFAGQSNSDQVGILALYKAYMAVRQNRKRARDFCNKYFLSQSAMEMFIATRRQIAELVSHKFRTGAPAQLYSNDWNMVRFCLVAGFYPNVALIDRSKNALISGAEKSLVLQRTSALNPPGVKNLKDFVKNFPHDWVIFYEKSRIANMCSINMNTIVPPLIIALQCGRDYYLENDDDGDDSDSTENDEDVVVDPRERSVNLISDVLNSMQLTDDHTDGHRTILCLDNWLKFQMDVSDAKLLMVLRTFVQAQFTSFLHHGHTPQTAMIANCVQRLLSCLGEKPVVV